MILGAQPRKWPLADGKAWTTVRVRELRERLSIAPFDPASKTEEMITIDKAALRLGICVGSIYKLIRQGVLPATQLIPSAPWEIPVAALDTESRGFCEVARHGARVTAWRDLIEAGLN